jgi:ribosomal protein L7/L12
MAYSIELTDKGQIEIHASLKNLQDLQNLINDIYLVKCRLLPPARDAEFEEFLTFLNEGKKIYAIKSIRSMTGCGLKEANDVIKRERVT